MRHGSSLVTFYNIMCHHSSVIKLLTFIKRLCWQLSCCDFLAVTVVGEVAVVEAAVGGRLILQKQGFPSDIELAVF